MNNLDYFKLSLKIKEPIANDEYLTDRIVITRNANQTNKLIEANKKIIKNITAYEIATGREGKKLRNKIIKFNWTKSHQGKLPDLFINLGGKYLVIEHKHMKESGGGQNKQMVEIIDFIKYKENGVSYLVFLDGLFFNKYAKELQKGKLKNQYAAIIKNLKNNPDNYFVNTTGFQKYIKRFVK